jgi:hypothetical protein
VAIDRARGDGEPAGMTVVRLAAEERLTTAFARYDEAWSAGDELATVAARIELCAALVELGEVLEPPVRAQLERDRALLAAREVVTV